MALGATLFTVQAHDEAERVLMRAPTTVPDPSLPAQVTIYEVGPRDGLQNEQALVPTEVKAGLCRRLLDAGLPVVEATSFVHPRWVPQLADAADLLTMLTDQIGDRARELPVLVPNERGLDRALELGCRHVAIFGSATETFAQRNLNRSLDEQFAMFEPTVRRARDAGLDVRAYVSMCFGDPWEGAVPVDQVVDVGRRLFDLGASQLSLGDTIGVGTAGPRDRAARRLHRGRASASTTSRCTSTTPTARRSPTPTPRCAPASRRTTPAPAASAAAPTRTARPATSPPRTSSGCCTGLGIETGVDLDAVVATSTWLAGELGRPSPSAVVRALGGTAEEGTAESPA